MPNKCFNVVLNTFNSTLETIANATSDKSYFIDWSARMPEGKYKLSFTFISEGNEITNFATIPVVYSDIVSSSSNTILPQATVYQNTQILGTLYPTSIYRTTSSNVCSFRADLESNPPVYLNNRPFNNLFKVQIFNNNNPPVLYLDEATAPATIGTYMLILNFELLEEYKLY